MPTTRNTSKPAKPAVKEAPKAAAKTKSKAATVRAEPEVVAPKPAAPRRKARSNSDAVVEPADRQRFIAEAAYYIAERRGFGPGGELDDWLLAEMEIDRLLQGTGPAH